MDGSMPRDLVKEIKDIMRVLNDNKGTERNEKARLIAIAVTQLETASLYVKEAQNL